jgi:glycosyltransferase involved in cell wall biosynthesis
MIQDGARLHYALPVAMQRAGVLEAMFTEWFVRPGSIEAVAASLVSRVKPGLGRRMGSRRCDELKRPVVTNPVLAVRHQISRRRFGTSVSFDNWRAEAVAGWVAQKGFGDANVLMGFIRNLHPALCRRAKERGVLVVADQIIAPATVELEAARRERERWPGWERHSSEAELQPYVAWETETWEQLDHLTCGSTYVADGLVASGVTGGKIAVLPYPIDTSAYRFVDRSGTRAPLTVGFVGSVSLRKGAPYFLEVARALAGPGVRFVMVGPVEVEPAKLAAYSAVADIVGGVSRGEIASWLERFDLFLFPSTCEGSASSVMEALSMGLPVVTTPNSGSVVRDGIEGFVVPSGDVTAMRERVSQLLGDQDRRLDMGRSARMRAETFTLDEYSRALREILEQAVSGRSGGDR